MSEQADVWAWWEKAKADPSKIGTEELPVHHEPNTGFFRVRTKGGQWEPVQIWKDVFDRWQATRSGVPVDERKVGDLWIWACRQPISEEAYDDALDGKGFPDEPPPTPGIGDNSKDLDPRDALNIEFLGEREAAEAMLRQPITTQDDADKAAIWSKRLADIGKKAEQMHSVEKQPVRDEGKRIDDRWAFGKDAQYFAKKLKAHQQDFLDELDRRERQRAAEERRKAEEIRRQAAEAAAKAEAEQSPEAMAQAGKLVAEAQEAFRAAEYVPPSTGRTGARVSLRTFTSADVNDWSALIDALKEREEVRELCQKIANKAAQAGFPLPGTTIKTERRPV